MKKWWMVIAVVVVLFLSGCASEGLEESVSEDTEAVAAEGEDSQGTETNSESDEETATEEEEVSEETEEVVEEEAPKEVETIPVQTLDGSGNKVESVSLASGFGVFHFTHQGSSNIIVQLKDQEGNSVELLVNDVGNYDGERFVMLPEGGEYYIEVQADGSWTGEIDQNIPEEVYSDTETLSGVGNKVLFVDMKSGYRTFTMSHSGESNFIVQVNGSGLLVNEIGNYQGETAQQFQDDAIYALSVQADGEWTINIK